MMIQTKNTQSKKKVNKKKSCDRYIYFDTSKKYVLPMLKLDVTPYIENEEKVSGVTIKQDESTKFFVRASKEGYQDKWFADRSFDWLLYTGYISVDGGNKDE